MLKLELNLERCFINLARECLTDFLGFKIRRYIIKTTSDEVFEGNIIIKKLNQKAIDSPSLLIPTKRILERLHERG